MIMIFMIVNVVIITMVRPTFLYSFFNFNTLVIIIVLSPL